VAASPQPGYSPEDCWSDPGAVHRHDQLFPYGGKPVSMVRDLERCETPSLFLTPMDWILEQTVHKGLVGATLGEEVFLDLDYANDIALLAEMLEVHSLSLHVMQEEARPFGLEINWYHDNSSTDISSTTLHLQTFRLL